MLRCSMQSASRISLVVFQLQNPAFSAEIRCCLDPGREHSQHLIDRCGIEPGDRIYYLQKYLGGAAKECIEGYLLLSSDMAYDEAQTLLEQRYGDQQTL